MASISFGDKNSGLQVGIQNGPVNFSLRKLKLKGYAEQMQIGAKMRSLRAKTAANITFIDHSFSSRPGFCRSGEYTYSGCREGLRTKLSSRTCRPWWSGVSSRSTMVLNQFFPSLTVSKKISTSYRAHLPCTRRVSRNLGLLDSCK